jgi:hypothetical protein
MDLTNIGYTPTIPEDLNTFDLNKQTSGTDNSVFNYYRNVNTSEIGVSVGTNDNSDIIFQIAKNIDYVRIGTLYYKWSGTVNIGGGELTLYGKDGINIILNNWKSCTLSTDDNNFNIKKNENDKITITYGTDLTNLGTDMSNLETRLTTLESGSGSNNLITFRQSIIDHTLIHDPNANLFLTITSGEKYSTKLKTLVGEDIYPKTTHTLLTAYYTSFIKTLPQTTNAQYKQLIRYYSTIDDTYPAIYISAVNSTYYTSPRLCIEIRKNDAAIHKSYIITPTTPKVVFDLTADLAEARPNEEIKDAEFASADYGGDSEIFYKHCVNILSNVFISYTYED